MSVASSVRMGTPFFLEFKKQASFFLREQIKNARLALTDVTPVELMTEDATKGNPWAPDAKTMAFISRAAFEIDDYWRIVEILHKRFNWGLAVRKKSERVLKMLEKGPMLKEERDQARKVTRGIQGFGSFNYRWSNGSVDSIKHASEYFGRCNSHYEGCNQHEEETLEKLEQILDLDAGTRDTSLKRDVAIKIHEKEEATAATATVDDVEGKGLRPEEVKSLLAGEEMERLKVEFEEDEHPFNAYEHQRMESMLLLSQS
ncbi:hypothetical protein AXF42_Ash017456 [Apostasia shenzhenica]|uniref:ENTH domain-containing protein n=1 Tax=Apostasia shenzhenica TaxID=1088818 RepID=A0A2H9ZZ63_9ASPA|nr:hypothetical protein AXF42_Ash017456 [Apostasia shenzhenica]